MDENLREFTHNYHSSSLSINHNDFDRYHSETIHSKRYSTYLIPDDLRCGEKIFEANAVDRSTQSNQKEIDERKQSIKRCYANDQERKRMYRLNSALYRLREVLFIGLMAFNHFLIY